MAEQAVRGTAHPYLWWFLVDHVHDGDTVMGTLDLGFRIQRVRAALRFEGINAPELGADGGVAARDFLMQQVAPGDWLRVDSSTWDRDKYDRVMGVPFTEDGTNLAELMVQSGHAVAY